jgi:hypothetical protein
MEENAVVLIDSSFNLFENIPIELTDIIFKFCAIDSNNNGSKQYVQYKIYNDILVIFEYIGDMGATGLPYGIGTIMSASNYHIIPYNKMNNSNTILNNNTETIWLYVPFFYVFKNYKPIFTNVI